MKIWQKILIVFATLLLAIFGAAMVWSVRSSYKAEPAVQSYLASSAQVLVTKDGWISFQPAATDPSVGFIFYPGGNVDYLAYAPALYQIAADGFLVVDVSMPFNLAVLAADRAQGVIEAHPEINTWVIGGHSLGGAMAARFVHQNPDLVEGLVFWAAFPADSNPLADSNIKVLSLYGTMDGVAPPSRIERRFDLLPADTIYIAIEGANHSQFGYYGMQNRDHPAEISRQEQQSQVISATVEFLRTFEP